MKPCYLLLALLLLAAAPTVTAQTVTVHSGSTATVQNSATATTYGSLSVDGTLATQPQSSLHFAGAGGLLSAAAPLSLWSLYLSLDDPDDALVLATGFDLREDLTIDRGDLDLNGFTVDLGTTGLLSEQPGHTVRGEAGQIQATRTLNAPSTVDVGGLGAFLTTQANLGDVTVVRRHALPEIDGAASIRRTYDINPTGTNTGLNATLTLRYDASELDQASEDDLTIYQTDDDGQTWKQKDSDVDANSNEVTATNLDNLSGFTAAADLADLLRLAGTMLLQGPHTGNGEMAALLTEAHLPETDPYDLGDQVAPAFFGTPEGEQIVDWVWLQFRTGDPANPPMQTIYERAALLRQDGQIVDTDGVRDVGIQGIAPGNYYLVVGHRNHLAAMTQNPIACTETACIADLKKQPAHGTDGTIQISDHLFALYAGDASANGRIQDDDKNGFWNDQTGTAGYLDADFNLNAQVQNNDKNALWLPNKGQRSQVPASNSPTAQPPKMSARNPSMRLLDER